jgi:tetratricopeptide (TPR) repeat protein
MRSRRCNRRTSKRALRACAPSRPRLPNASTLLLDHSRNAEATQWAQLATLESNALGDPDIAFRALTAQANVDMYSNHTEHAIALMTEALMMLRGDAGYRYADALQTRAEAYDKHGDVELAVADADKARDIYARMSDTNLALVNVENDRANFLIHAGHIDEAVAAARHGVAMAEKLDSQDSILVGTSKGTLGNALTAAHRFDEALQLLDASLAVDLKDGGEHGYNVASDHNNRCDLLARMHRTREAMVDCKLAVQLWPETAGTSSIEMAETETNLGEAQIEIKAYRDAVTSLDAAIVILSARSNDSRVLLPLIARATAHRALDQYAEARRDLDAAKPFVGEPGPVDWPPRYELELALVELHDGHRDRAHELATAARDGFAALHDPLAAEAAELLKK